MTTCEAVTPAASKHPLSKKDEMPQAMFEEETEEQVAQRVAGYLGGACTNLMIGLGDRLGIFKKMAAMGPASSTEIASACSLSERWVREMMFQLASSKVVSTDEEAQIFWLTRAQARVVAYEEGPDATDSFMGVTCYEVCLGAKNMDKLETSFKTGLGLKYDDYGHEMNCSICREFQGWTRRKLLENMRTIPGLHDMLTAGATVADVGCGCGIALCVLGEAYPNSTFHGYDISEIALDTARKASEHLPNVSLSNPEKPGGGMPTATYDFIITLDAVHDMAHPDTVLGIVRRGLKEGALGYLVSDPRSLGGPADNIRGQPEFSMVGYTYSVILCMSSGLSEEGGMGLGTLGWHAALAERMLKDAGFSTFEQLDWENPLNAFYLARP